jgi:hypothetical protein
MKRVAFALLLVMAIAIGGAWFLLRGNEFEFRFTQEQLLEKLSERMPLHKRYLILFEVELDNPRLTLVEGSDRVNAGLDAALNIQIQIGEQALRPTGTLDASGGVRYDSERGQFFLTDPVIEHFEIQGIPERYTNQANRVLSMALSEYYADRPIYTLNTAKLKQAMTKLVLKRVVVEGGELVVILGL